MRDNAQYSQNKEDNDSQISIVHIFSYPPTNLENIENNASFLSTHNVEYIILDNLNQKENKIDNDFLLKNISQLPSFINKKIIYLKEDFENLKQSFLTTIEITKNSNIYFILNQQILNLENIQKIEKVNPYLLKSNLNFFKDNVPNNFKFENYKLYMKTNKTIFDKVKIILLRYF